MNVWRVLKLETHNAFMNMAIDEAVLEARVAGLVPNTVRFYQWMPSAVSVGKFQKVEDEVHLENCGKHGVDVVRRMTGGGTVYHDSEGEITYSVVASKKEIGAHDATAFYERVYRGIAEALQILGVAADFREGDGKNCPNLTVRGRKISGSSQCHRGDVVLQHGTLLLDVDLERMFTLLRVPWAKTSDEIMCVAKNRITSLKAELGNRASIPEISNALVQGFEKSFGASLAEEDLLPFERGLAQKLCEKKYSLPDWNFLGKTALG